MFMNFEILLPLFRVIPFPEFPRKDFCYAAARKVFGIAPEGHFAKPHFPSCMIATCHPIQAACFRMFAPVIQGCPDFPE
jgi:hypothetical protein